MKTKSRSTLRRVEQEPSETLRDVALRLRKLAIADPRILPIAEKIERIAESQAEYEKARPDGR